MQETDQSRQTIGALSHCVTDSSDAVSVWLQTDADSQIDCHRLVNQYHKTDTKSLFPDIAFMVSEHLNRNVASSQAIYTYIARSAQLCRNDWTMDYFLNKLCQVVRHTEQSLGLAGATVDLQSGSIVIQRDGQVTGFEHCILSGCIHSTIKKIFETDPRLDNVSTLKVKTLLKEQ